MSKEVMKKENTSLAVQEMGAGMFGFEDVSAKDIKIPIIYIAQAMSDIVSEGDSKPGDIVDNLNNKVLGSAKKPVQVIPFYFQKSYVVQKLVNSKKEFVTNEPYDREREYEEVRDGTTYYNLPCFNFFVLIKGDETFTRYALSFRGSRNITSGGRPMLSQLMNKFQTLKAAPFNFVFDIGVKQVENEKGKWFVFTSNQSVVDGKEVLTLESEREVAALAYKDIEAMFKAGKTFDLGSEHDEPTASTEAKELF